MPKLTFTVVDCHTSSKVLLQWVGLPYEHLQQCSVLGPCKLKLDEEK
jgi:hypothetical protein